MASHKLVSFHFIQSLIILIFSTTLANSALNPFVSPHLSVRPPSWLVRRGADESPAATNFTEFTLYEYEQTIDHFTFRPESYLKFKQRYVINPKHWGGAKSKSPIFVYLGAEESVEEEVAVIGLLYENAHKFKAMLVFIEGTLTPLSSLSRSTGRRSSLSRSTGRRPSPSIYTAETSSPLFSLVQATALDGGRGCEEVFPTIDLRCRILSCSRRLSSRFEAGESLARRDW